MAVETLQNRLFGAKSVSLGAFITPQGNGGQATPDYVGEAEDYTTTGLPGLVDGAFNPSGGSGSKKGKEDDRSGEYYNLLRDIVDNPNLTDSEKEYRVANARRAYKYTLTQSQLIEGQRAVQMSEEQTAKGMIDMENRKDQVETYKNDAKFAVENDPTMADKPMEERAEYGKAQRENASIIYTGLMALTMAGDDKVKDAAATSTASAIMNQMPSNLFERAMKGEINAKDENDLTISISKILQDPDRMGIGNTMTPQEAWALGNRVSQMYFGNLRKMRTDYEKMTIEEQKNFLELRKQATIMALPVQAQASLALFDYNASNMPELTRQAMLEKLPATKYDMVDGERVWAQGAPYDKDVVNMGLTHGTDQTKVASLNRFLQELDANTDKYNAGDELYNLSQVDNLKDAYAVAGPRAKQAMLKSITDVYTKQLTNRIQSYTNSGLWTNIKRMFGGKDTSLDISPDTMYVMSGPNAADINDELAKTQKVLEHFGMGSDEYYQVLKAGLEGTGVQMPEGHYSPSELRAKTMENMKQYIAEENAKEAKTAEEARNISPELSNTYREFNAYYKTLEQQVKNGEVDDAEAAAMLRNKFVEVTGTSEAQQETRKAVNDMEYRQYFKEQMGKVMRGEIDRDQANKNLEDFRNGKLNEPRGASINMSYTQANAFELPKQGVVSKGLDLINNLIGVKKANAMEASMEFTKLNELSPSLENKYSSGNNYIVYKDSNGHRTIGHGVLLDKEARDFFKKNGYINTYVGHQIPKDLVDKYMASKYQEKNDMTNRQFEKRGISPNSIPDTMRCISNDLCYIGKPAVGFFDKAAKVLKAKTEQERQQCIVDLKKHINSKVVGNTDRKKRLLELADSL